MRERDEDESSVVERLVTRDLDDDAGRGSPLSERARQSQRSVETYLKGGGVPRWMERGGDRRRRRARGAPPAPRPPRAARQVRG
ncbi:MAG: hypothetical protein M3P50_09745 [Actinomycetota bacterium]|nr:hypothetical protein [Actinomycetota bacterium]